MSLNRSDLVLDMKYIEAMERVEGMPCSSVVNGTEIGSDPVVAQTYQGADCWRGIPPAISSVNVPVGDYRDTARLSLPA